jgi:hypothetical protein
VCPGRPYSSSVVKKEADRTGRYPGAPVPTGRARLRASGEPRHVYLPGWRPGIDDMAPPSTGRHAGVVSLSFSQLYLAWNFLSGWVPSAVPLVRRRKLFYATCLHGMFKRNQRLPRCGASGLNHIPNSGCASRISLSGSLLASCISGISAVTRPQALVGSDAAISHLSQSDRQGPMRRSSAAHGCFQGMEDCHDPSWRSSPIACFPPP